MLSRRLTAIGQEIGSREQVVRVSSTPSSSATSIGRHRNRDKKRGGVKATARKTNSRLTVAALALILHDLVVTSRIVSSILAHRSLAALNAPVG